MTKQTIALILTIFLYVVNYSQSYTPFPNDSSTWLVAKYCIPPCDPFSDNQPQQVVQHGDSLKNGIQYHKLYMVHTGTNSPNFICFYRELNKRIYIKYPLNGIFGNDTTEFVLFDFNLNIGDTFSIKTPTNISGALPNMAKMKLYSITSGTVSYATGIHKLYNFGSVTTPSPTSLVINIIWCEGIGSNQGLLYNLAFRSWPISVSPPNAISYNLNCFLKSNSLLPNNTCISTNIPNIKNSLTSFLIYPNPSIDIITLNNIENIKSIVLYNTLGNICLNETYQQKMKIINIEHLSQGIYHLRINQYNNEYTDLKLIKK